MLPPKNRVDKKNVDLIFKKGNFLNSPNLTFKFLLIKGSLQPRISFIVPKNISKKAVVRNLLRRRGYIALEKHLKSFPVSLLGVFIFKKYQDDILILENEIKNILYKID